jgi:hypothetical protein
LLSVDINQVAGEVYQFYDANGSLLLGASNGLFRLDGNKLTRIAGNQDTGGVYGFYDFNGTLLIRAHNGAFRLDSNNLTQIAADQDTGEVYGFYDFNGTLLVRAQNGPFRLDGGKLTRIAAKQDTGSANSFYNANGTLLVGASKGVFRLDGDKLARIYVHRDTGPVRGFFDANGTLFVKTYKGGLFRLEGDKLTWIAADRETGGINELYNASGTVFVAAERGLFRFQKDKQRLVAVDRDAGAVFRFYNTNGALFVGGFYGLSRLEGDRLIGVAGSENIGAVTGFIDANGIRLVGSSKGLFRLEGGKLAPIAADQASGAVSGFYNARGTLLVIARNGPFRLDVDPWASGTVTPSRLSEDLPIRTSTTLIWTVQHACAFALTGDEVKVVPELDSTKQWEVTVKHLDGAIQVEATGAFANKSDEAYNVQLELKEDTGNFVPVGKAVSVLVGWTFYNYVQYYSWWAVRVISAAYLIFFLVMIIGAHWYAFCWRIVTDPIWNKVQVGFYFTLRHAGPLQRWIMARWFDEVRKGISREPYLPMTLSDLGDRVVGRSTDLLDHGAEWKRLWIQGNPGMGKSALVRYLESAFFADEGLPTLGSAFRRFGYVPIIVSLREYRHVSFDPSHPEDWVLSVARMAASSLGVTFEGDGPFRSMIKSGSFLLILDGANEVERDDAIDLFARSAPAARVLVTSQVPKEGDYFSNWHLPRTIKDEIEPLLCLFLGQELGERTFNGIRATPLFAAIQSGYDVRLIASLIESQTYIALPTDRLGLYRLILSTIRLPDGTQFPEENLCKAAWAMWSDGERKLEVGKHIGEDLLGPLVQEGQKVLRTLGGQRFEFRHDLMRAYLAARWAAYHDANPEGLLDQKKAIWRLSYKEQDEVWNFFADMIVATKLPIAIKLWKWATEDSDRVILQHALQRALKQVGLDPNLTGSIQRGGENGARAIVSDDECPFCSAVRISSL